MARLIEQVQGHDAVWADLQRLRQSNRLPHALALVGPHGVGKRLLANALAQALVCESDRSSPCGECSPCRRAEAETHESILRVENEGETIKIDTARSIVDFFHLRQIGRARVAVVNEAEALNPQAANTLLKIVEEPPPGTFLIFTVSEIARLLPTLRSRLQIVRVRPLSVEWLQKLRPEAEPWMWKACRGSLGRIDGYRHDELRARAFELLERGLANAGGLEEFMDVAKDKQKAPEFLHYAQEFLRDWTVPVDQRLHADFSDRMMQWPARSDRKKTELWRQALQVQIDFDAHLDRGLVLQNFYSHLRDNLG